MVLTYLVAVPQATHLLFTQMKSKSNKLNSEPLITLPFTFCICCGKNERLKHHTFTYQQESSIAQFSKLAGNGIDTILGYVLTKDYNLQAMFCGRCGKRMDKFEFIGQIFHLIFALLILLTIILSTIINSFFGFQVSLYTLGLGILFTIGFRIWVRYYNWKYFPKIKRIDEKFVVIKIPGKGKLKYDRVLKI